MFRKVIAAQFKETGTKRKDFCAKTGITASILSNFLAGNTNLSLVNLEKTLDYFKISLAKTNEERTEIKIIT